MKTNKFLNRSCAGGYLSDCKEANNIEFCYCTQDLCNFLTPFGDNEEGDGKTICSTLTQFIIAIFFLEIFEGSGLETSTTSKVTSTIENLLPKSLCSICQFSNVLLSLSALFLMYLFIP